MKLGEKFWDSFVDGIVQIFYDLMTWLVQQMLVYAHGTISEAISFMSDGITDTPQTWNASLFTSLRTLTDTAIVPIGIGIMSIILCYDLITACIDRNNFKEFDTSIFFRFIVKAWVAIYLINNVYTIIGALFQIGANIAETASTQLLGEASEMGEYLSSELFRTALYDFDGFDLVLSFFISLGVFIVTLAIIIIVMLVTAGRMVEILVTMSVAPIPFATMTNKEWGSMGFTYIKTILALALQAFLIVITLAIYIILFNNNIADAVSQDTIGGLTGSLLRWLCYGIICCFMLLKTGSISKSICGAH